MPLKAAQAGAGGIAANSNRHRKNHSEAGQAMFSSQSCDQVAFQTLTFYNGSADAEIKEKPSMFESCEDLINDQDDQNYDIAAQAADSMAEEQSNRLVDET